MLNSFYPFYTKKVWVFPSAKSIVAVWSLYPIQTATPTVQTTETSSLSLSLDREGLSLVAFLSAPSRDKLRVDKLAARSRRAERLREYIEGVCNGLCPVLIGTGVTDLRLSQALGCYKWASLNFKRYRDQLKVTQILFNNILVGPAEKLLKTRVGTNMLQPHNPRLDWAFAEWLSLGREALSTS